MGLMSLLNTWRISLTSCSTCFDEGKVGDKCEECGLRKDVDPKREKRRKLWNKFGRGDRQKILDQIKKEDRELR